MKGLLFICSLLVAISQPVAADADKLSQAINGSQRTAAWADRDIYRHPLQTLQLFDIQPQHTVVEVWPGGGWYTEILAPYLRQEGMLVAAHYDATDTQASYRAGSRQRFEEKLSASPAVYDKVKVSSLTFDESAGTVRIAAAEANSIDRVVTFRNAHGWRSTGTTSIAFDHFFDILKPGGKLGIVQHMADPDQDWLSRSIGYVGRDYLISEATRAGFQLHAEGYFNRNPLDNKRYEVGVWQLPPSLRNMKTDAEKAPYLAIGESDRMTLVFVKP